MHLGAAEMSEKSWGGRAGGVDLGTDLPYGCRALPMYSSPSIDLVQRFYRSGAHAPVPDSHQQLMTPKGLILKGFVSRTIHKATRRSTQRY